MSGLPVNGYRRRRPRARWLRMLSGLLAGGMVALAVFLAVAAVIAVQTASPGPSAGLVVGHVLAAFAAVLGQRWVDRRPGPSGAAAAGGLALLTTVGLVLHWLV